MSTDAKKDPESRKNLLISDTCVDDDTTTVPVLEISDEPSLEFDTSKGFNPYDTGSLYKK